jgi:signal transduction histidine kinase
VEISARQVDYDVQIDVRDTGIGIPPDALAHVFDEFCQVDAGASRRYGGTGLAFRLFT